MARGLRLSCFFTGARWFKAHNRKAKTALPLKTKGTNRVHRKNPYITYTCTLYTLYTLNNNK